MESDLHPCGVDEHFELVTMISALCIRPTTIVCHPSCDDEVNDMDVMCPVSEKLCVSNIIYGIGLGRLSVILFLYLWSKSIAS